MRVSELKNAPQWLLEARVENEDVDIVNGRVVWYYGEWCGGVWRGGVWYDGVWCDGVWCDGEWRGGEWNDANTTNRMLYMAALIGIVPDSSGVCVAYRTTKSDGSGRYSREFTQPEGEYYEDDAAEAGTGTCRRGIHVTTAARAWTYFGIDPSCQMWEARFHVSDLLDCDGEKARIRGGTFRKIGLPWST